MSEPISPARPLPRPTADSEPYWAAAHEGRLAIQRCASCGRHQFYPRAFCTTCLSDRVEWMDASGRGRIYTFTVCRIAAAPAFEAALPYAVALVELDEGVRLLANIVDCDIARIAIGAPVAVRFERIDDDCTLPQFTLID